MTDDVLDPILAARLADLESNVRRTIRVCDAQTRDFTLTDYAVDDAAWNAAFVKVRSRANQTRSGIEALRDNISDRAENYAGAWRRYQKLNRETRDVARSCVDLMSAFALREHMPKDPGGRFLDQKLCRFTEKLLEKCRELTTDPWPPLLAIPDSGALAETMARIVRVQFPEWTIWTLPLVASEYARVVFPEIAELEPTIQDEIERRTTADDASDREAADRAVRTLSADAFGVYVMGPAYVCATTLLRLDPLGGESAIEDVERAEVIFASACRIYEAGSAPRRFLDDHLRAPWNAARARALPDLEVAPLETAADEFAGRMHRKISRETYAEAKFAANQESGEDWTRAERLSQTWINRIENADAEPGHTGGYRLREILNAAWRARMLKPEATADLGHWAREECDVATREDELSGAEISHPKGPAR